MHSPHLRLGVRPAVQLVVGDGEAQTALPIQRRRSAGLTGRFDLTQLQQRNSAQGGLAHVGGIEAEGAVCRLDGLAMPVRVSQYDGESTVRPRVELIQRYAALRHRHPLVCSADVHDEPAGP